MSIRAREIGKVFRVKTSFDLSAATTLEVHFTGPNAEITDKATPDVTAPGVDVTDPDLGLLEANTYMEFKTIATDFPVKGTWTGCSRYIDPTPKDFAGPDTEFEVLEGCPTSV